MRVGIFSFCDPEMSFGDGSPGRAALRITSAGWGHRLGIEAWRLGEKAYSKLGSIDGKPPSTADLKGIIESHTQWIGDFLEMIARSVDSGKLQITTPEGKPHGKLNWSDASFRWKVALLVELLKQMKHDDDDGTAEFLQTFQFFILVGALEALDEAVLASLDADVELVSDCVLDAAHLIGEAWRIDAPVSAPSSSIQAQARDLLSAVARKAAKARVELDRSGKAAAMAMARSYFDRWTNEPSLYQGPTAFAKDMIEKSNGVLESVPVLVRKVAEWRRKSTQRAE